MAVLLTEHSEPPFCVKPLTVAEGKTLRLVIDLRHVNCHLVRFKFKYEDLRSLSQVLQEGHWFFTWDLKSGYHHVDSVLSLIWHILSVIWHVLSLNWHTLSLI